MQPTEKRINSKELQKIFNEKGFWERASSGELKVEVMSEKHPSPLKSAQPPCTLSQILAYFDNQGQEVARVHQYKRPDGSLGGSGRPDPKRLFINGVIYKI
ncbi:MAG: hypothetical protein FJ128_10375 [Deltaproteobacteria bacterium]|nr:hypothetical protein [Deltaproteobacteria bacterium]